MKDKLLIWILSLFIGLFLTLIFIIYNNYFIKTKKNFEQFADSDTTNSPLLISEEEWSGLEERQRYNKILENIKSFTIRGLFINMGVPVKF